MRRGFLLGKFLPPHAGHLFLCRTAAAMVDRLTVLVCSIDAEPIPGHLRHEWMRALLPQCRVVHMHRDIPQEPADHPDFWPIWRAAIREHHPEPVDRVFASEDYVFRLAAELGAEPVMIDPARVAVPVSGRAIRAAPHAHWRFVPEPVRPWFQRRVCLLGPESAGKTTLAAALAERFGTVAIPEYGRVYDAHYRQGEAWGPQDFITLAETHLAIAAALAPTGGPVLIEDTDPIQTAVWAEMLLGRVPDALVRMVETFRRADLYLLLSPEVPWFQDGTRYWGDQAVRERFHARCRAWLDRLGCT